MTGSATTGALAAAAVVSSNAAAAQPPLPPPPIVPTFPAPPPPFAGGPAALPIIDESLGSIRQSPMAQTGAFAAGPFGLSPADVRQFLLPQAPTPLAPGRLPGTPPDLNALNNAYLLPQHEKPSAPGEGTVFDVPPGAENADISGLDYVKRVWHLYESGYLKGALLGQRPQAQLACHCPVLHHPPEPTSRRNLCRPLRQPWSPCHRPEAVSHTSLARWQYGPMLART